MSAKTKALLVDVTRCIGCQSCVQACKQAHQLPEGTATELSATALTVVQERDGRFVRRLCMHCQDPACVSVCPVGALQKTAAGPVVYQADRCFGCRYCMLACPFKVPRYEWSKVTPYVKKCDFCAERVAQGEAPACVDACPVAATEFGDRDALLAEARRRITENPAYVPRIYGADIIGGTSVFFISDVAFESLGFPTLGQQPRPTLAEPALKEIPNVALVGGALLSALYWMNQRRLKVALAEAEEQLPGAQRDREPVYETERS